MAEITELEILVLGALLIVSLVVVLGKRFRVHPAVGLVIAGVLLTGQAAVEIPLSSELILSLFLPTSTSFAATFGRSCYWRFRASSSA